MYTVLDIGNCDPDHRAIRQMLEQSFDVQVLRAQQAADAFELLNEHSVSLITINRKLDCDYSDGIDIIRQLKADERFKEIPVMLVTNYEEHQQAAMGIGAQRGFGKLQLQEESTRQLIASVLS